MSTDEDPDVVPPNLNTMEGQIQQVQKTNWQVMNITTPANYYHALRRQLHREFRKPLILASAKAQLRDRLAVSTLDASPPRARLVANMFEISSSFADSASACAVT